MVRVINGRDEHPLSKQTVFAQFLDEQPTKVSSPQQITTDGNGEAEVSIPEPQPRHLNIRLALTPDHWHCSCWVMTDTENVVRDGIVQVAAMTKPTCPGYCETRTSRFHRYPLHIFRKNPAPARKAINLWLAINRVGVGDYALLPGEGDADASQESKLAGSDCGRIYVQEEIPNYGDAT
jgi:hypothetical protein